MALKQFAIIDDAGNAIGTQVCEGETCYPALQPGQSRLEMATGAESTIPAGTTVIDPAGARVKPFRPERFIPEPTPAILPRRQRPVVMEEPEPVDPIASALVDMMPNQQPIAPPVATQPEAMPPSPLPSAMPSRFPSGGGTAIPPTYADGTMHPSQGGPPRIPGGPAAQQDGGYDNRQQVTSTSDATAGPFGVRAAPAPRQDAYGGNAIQGSGGGGGGSSLAKDMYYRIKGAVEGKIAGMGPGGTSSGDYPTDASYARTGRRMDRAYDKFNEMVANPDPQPARGWAKREMGKNRGDFPAMLARPEMVLSRGLDFDFTDQETANYGDWMRDLPMADLAMIAGGSMSRKTRAVKPPKILAKSGVEPYKPENKRELDYSKFAKQLADMYRGLSGPEQVLDENALMGDLANARNKGALRQGIDMQAEFDPGGAMDRARGYFDSITSLMPISQREGMANLTDRYFAEAMATSRKPKRIDQIVNEVARRFLNG